MPDTVVKLGPGFPSVNVLFLAPDDLAQIGLGEKAHRCAGAVVEISGLGDELLARLFDEGDVRRGAKEGIPQLLGREALERIVEGQCVQEDGPGNVNRVGRQAAVILGIDLLGQGLLSRLAGGDIVGDRRYIGGLTEACDDLLADRLIPRIDMVEMDRGRIGRPLFPQMGDRARQQPQHATHPLEIVERGHLAGQGLQHFRMQRIARPEYFGGLGARGVAGKRVPVGRP